MFYYPELILNLSRLYFDCILKKLDWNMALSTYVVFSKLSQSYSNFIQSFAKKCLYHKTIHILSGENLDKSESNWDNIWIIGDGQA